MLGKYNSATTAPVMAVALALAALAPSSARGAVPASPGPQATPSPRPEPTPSPVPEPSPAPSPRPAHRAVVPTLALGLGGPLLASVSAGLILGTDRAAPDECPSPRGLLAQAEAGVGGGKLSLGPVFTYCQTRFGALGAGALQAAFVRTWGSPLGTEAEASYVGGELDLGVVDWKVTLGLLKRVRGPEDAKNLLFTWGLARGF